MLLDFYGRVRKCCEKEVARARRGASPYRANDEKALSVRWLMAHGPRIDDGQAHHRHMQPALPGPHDLTTEPPCVNYDSN